jgi:Ca2+/Na+ antiporter
MKVEFILQLWNSFNKKIWGNKQFSIFLYVFIIIGTILLRQSPGLYYGLLEHPIYISLGVIIILALSSHNMILSILLTVSILALYYPSIPYSVEGFKPDEDDNEDDEKEFKLKTVDPTDNNIDLGEDDLEDEPEDEPEDEEKPKKKSKKSSDKEKFKDQKKKAKGLEDINPEFFLKKNQKEDKNTEETDDEDEKEIPKTKKNNKNNNKESFLGELREVFNDLDSGRNKMNAKTAVKKITDMIYKERRSEVEKILDEDDSDSDTDSDEDYF